MPGVRAYANRCEYTGGNRASHPDSLQAPRVPVMADVIYGDVLVQVERVVKSSLGLDVTLVCNT